MIRIEIIANHSVEENILEAFAEEQVGKFYTKFPSIFGIGSTGPRMGDAVWPEENFVMIIWCEPEEALGIQRALARVKEQFPGEGIKFFSLPEIREKAAADQEVQEELSVPAARPANPAPKPAMGTPQRPAAAAAVPAQRPTATPPKPSAATPPRPATAAAVPATRPATTPPKSASPAPKPAMGTPQRPAAAPAQRSATTPPKPASPAPKPATGMPPRPATAQRSPAAKWPKSGE